MSIVYGPVTSWRLGRSLGIDPICREPKVCSLNCIYCQLGKRGILTTRRSEFVSTDDLIKELEVVDMDGIEVVTFSGTGEPMLASNLKEMAESIKDMVDTPLAILTNSCHFMEEDRMEDLDQFDIVIARLDAANESTFRRVNRPFNSTSFDTVMEGIKRVKRNFGGSFRLQLMFLEENKWEAGEMADLCRDIDPELIYINTPLRPCTSKPLSRFEISEIVPLFDDMNIESVYD